MIGGFGKMPGDLPGEQCLCGPFPKLTFESDTWLARIDILHSHHGLVSLAIIREPDLKSIDPTLCISVSAKENFEQQMVAGEAG